MGLDVYSNVVYGKVISKEVLTQHKMIRGCNHLVDESKKFCPECGKPVWIETQEIIDFFNQQGIVTTEEDFSMHVFQHYSY